MKVWTFSKEFCKITVLSTKRIARTAQRSGGTGSARNGAVPNIDLNEKGEKVMSNQEVFDKVAQLIANRFSVDASTVTEGMTFQQDLGADSLDVVELVMELEDEFGVQISDEDAENITTIGDAVNYIASHQ